MQVHKRFLENLSNFAKPLSSCSLRFSDISLVLVCLKICSILGLPHLHNYFNLCVCLSLQRRWRPSIPSHNTLQFLQLDYKMLLIKVAWFVLRVKICILAHPQTYRVHEARRSIIRQGNAKLPILRLTSVFHYLPSIDPKHFCVLAHLKCTRGYSY